jgi:hypothetical protein
MDDIKIKGRTLYLTTGTFIKIKKLAIDNETTVSKFVESILSDFIKNFKNDS